MPSQIIIFNIHAMVLFANNLRVEGIPDITAYVASPISQINFRISKRLQSSRWRK